MFVKLALAFIIIPLIELSILIKVGQIIGVFPTIMIVALTGITGAFLAKTQGLIIVMQVKQSLERGEIPGNYILEGFLILVGGVMFLTPGFLTDFTGVLLIIPSGRKKVSTYIKLLLKKWFYF